MLFMIVAEHTAENCPGGIVRPDKQFMDKTVEAIKKSGVKLVEGYFDGPKHVFYIILEANDNTSIINAVEPLRVVGTVSISPVLKFTESVAWAKKIGIQE